ncbi:MAG: pantetheine-phosphate adenylyltransferase [Planctomycetota bacterium]|jgi:pantetheine-phosphate adenylyltransferase|nr:pantetheine-phosphate adenylyltransferase [Planctomycetota bacterium]MDP6409418.1 pantetheine-phosphate adenylyltransferase [Planctomycetota bacterium]MDP6540860.1 pantetheine-phosphate adenylyltransferase [Planctomycetota bacterium]
MAPKQTAALFPGTFDPLTLGHQDLVGRARELFGRVVVGVAVHPEKEQLFDAAERASLAREVTSDLSGVEVCVIEGLLVEACRTLGCSVIVRGVRGGADFDYEVSMARTNRELDGGIDTILLAPSPALTHISSTLVRQIASMGGDVSPFVAPKVARALRERFAS